MQQREADLLVAQGLVQEKEEALSREQQRSSQERAELQGQLADKVTASPEPTQRVRARVPACPHCISGTFYHSERKLPAKQLIPTCCQQSRPLACSHLLSLD